MVIAPDLIEKGFFICFSNFFVVLICYFLPDVKSVKAELIQFLISLKLTIKQDCSSLDISMIFSSMPASSYLKKRREL
jgi:hypothetical protein